MWRHTLNAAVFPALKLWPSSGQRFDSVDPRHFEGAVLTFVKTAPFRRPPPRPVSPTPDARSGGAARTARQTPAATVPAPGVLGGIPPSPGCSAGPGTPGTGGSRRHNRRAERGPQPNGRGLVTSSPYPASLVSKYPAIAALASSTLMPEVSTSIFGP